jgi:DNA primase
MSNRDYTELAEKHLDIALRSGDEFMAKCPHHPDNTASLQFNVRKGLWICFSCHRTGNAKSLFGTGWREIDVDIKTVMAQLELLEATDKKATRPVALAESTLKRYRFPTDYWRGRGFTDTTIKAFELGYDPIENDAIIPVRNQDHELLGVIRRRLAVDAMPKYLYYKGFPRKHSLFGSWLVAKKMTDHVVITEGSLDAIAVWQAGHPAVAVFGSSISREQVILLGRLGIQRITLFFDDDRSGREATLQALPMLRDFLVYGVSYADGDAKDPGATSPKRVSELVESARLIL